MVPKFEVEPDVYIKVTDNYIELTLRYIVDPKQRRKASSFIYAEVFRQMRERDDIESGSNTMDVSVHSPDPEAKRRRRNQGRRQSDVGGGQTSAVTRNTTRQTAE